MQIFSHGRRVVAERQRRGRRWTREHLSKNGGIRRSRSVRRRNRISTTCANWLPTPSRPKPIPGAIGIASSAARRKPAAETMSSLMVTEVQQNILNLKRELQKILTKKFEELAAHLLGKLLDVPFRIAKSGFQHGGDAGTVGKDGRRLRLECKRYSDSNALSDRELLGEIDQALVRDEALEAWILAATREVPEQLAQSLIQHGEKLGVPVIILDWKDQEISPLAALCAQNHDLIAQEVSKKAEEYAQAIQPLSDDALNLLRRDLQTWNLGFESIRIKSHDLLANKDLCTMNDF